MNRTCVAGLVSVAALASSASAQNLALNPSFEDFDPFSNVLDDWFRINNFFIEQVEVPPFDGVTNTKSFGQFFGNPNDQLLVQDVNLPDAAGKAFRVSVYCLSPAFDLATASNLDGGVGQRGLLPIMIAQFFNAGGVLLSELRVQSFDSGEDASDTWIRSVAQGIAPANTTRITLLPLLIQYDNAVGAVHWDLVELEEVSTIATPADLNDDGVTDQSDVATLIRSSDLRFNPVDNAPLENGIDYDLSGGFDYTDLLAHLAEVEAAAP